MDTTRGPQAGPFDEITEQLRSMRTAAGEPSYAEIVRRVVESRMARGIPQWEARVGRTTVYDAFRPGRRMIDATLVGDLVRSLGGGQEEIELWSERCREARRRPRPSLESAVGTAPAPHAPETPPDAVRAGGAEVAEGAQDEERVRAPAGIPGWALLAACLALNLCGRALVLGTHIPLYLDMVGTAIAAIAVGPWAGASVGVATSLAGVGIDGWVSAPFAPVEIAGALVWGYGVRRFGGGRSVPRFFLLNLVVAACCTLVAVPIIVWLDHGITGDGADLMTGSMLRVWHSLLLAVSSQNLLTSVADKLISGFSALAVCEALAPRALGAARLHLGDTWRGLGAPLGGGGR